MNTLPSRANSVLPPTRHATVVSRLFLDRINRSPVCISMKQPVPYVFLAMPGAWHACPNKAACWSPAMPVIGTGTDPSLASPYTSLDDRTSGSIERGTPKIPSNSSSQSPVRRL